MSVPRFSLNILCSKPLLQYPDFKKRFIVTYDASSNGIGSILSQGPLGHDLLIAYASRVLKAERNYSTAERELTATVWGCKQFRLQIWGQKFTIVTDRKPLKWIFKMDDSSSRIMRLKLKLQECDYTIVLKKGKKTGSDGLSTTFSETELERAVVNALTWGSRGSRYDSEESRDTEGKHRGEY